MGVVKNTLEAYVELTCPDNETGQQQLWEDIVDDRFALDMDKIFAVLVGPSGAFCNTCGESVRLGGGKSAERMPDLNSIEERRRTGRRFPAGDYVCGDCVGRDSHD